MSPIPIKKVLQVCTFSATERAKLKKKLQDRKAELEAAIRALSRARPVKRKRKKR
jgi:hypothetical protein